MTEWITSCSIHQSLFGWQGEVVGRGCFVFSLNSCNHTTLSKLPVSPILPRNMNGGAGHESQVLLTATEHMCSFICSCVLAFLWMTMEQLLSQLAEIQIFSLSLWNSYFRVSLPNLISVLQLGSVFGKHQKIWFLTYLLCCHTPKADGRYTEVVIHSVWWDN